MAQSKRQVFRKFVNAPLAWPAGHDDRAIPSPVHKLVNEVEANFARQGLFAHEALYDQREKKFPGWVRLCIVAIPTIALWSGIIWFLRAAL